MKKIISSIFLIALACVTPRQAFSQTPVPPPEPITPVPPPEPITPVPPPSPIAPNPSSPLVTFAENLLSFINNILVPLIFALAFLVFLWGVFRFFIAGGADEGKRAEGRMLMLYAVIGFVVMISIWGIVNLIAGGIGLTGQDLQSLPQGPRLGQ